MLSMKHVLASGVNRNTYSLYLLPQHPEQQSDLCLNVRFCPVASHTAQTATIVSA